MNLQQIHKFVNVKTQNNILKIFIFIIYNFLAPKPLECDYYVRLESMGFLPNSPTTNTSHAKVFLNDQ